MVAGSGGVNQLCGATVELKQERDSDGDQASHLLNMESFIAHLFSNSVILNQTNVDLANIERTETEMFMKDLNYNITLRL